MVAERSERRRRVTIACRSSEVCAEFHPASFFRNGAHPIRGTARGADSKRGLRQRPSDSLLAFRRPTGPALARCAATTRARGSARGRAASARLAACAAAEQRSQRPSFLPACVAAPANAPGAGPATLATRALHVALRRVEKLFPLRPPDTPTPAWPVPRRHPPTSCGFAPCPCVPHRSTRGRCRPFLRFLIRGLNRSGQSRILMGMSSFHIPLICRPSG